MVIDTHCHMALRDMIPEKYWLSIASIFSRIAGGSPEEVLKSEFMEQFWNNSTDQLIEEMEEAGIDKSIIFGVDWGLLLGEPKIRIDEANKFVADSAKEYSDKFISFFTIDPRRPKAPELFEKALTTWEMKGLKLHPTTGYFPDSEETYKLYNIAEEYKVPIITHCGYTIGLKCKTAKMEYFDGPTTDFPTLNFCFAHLSGGNLEELVNMMFMKPNIYTDISAHGQILMINSPPDFYRQLRFAMNHRGVRHRVLFASDWPFTNIALPLKKWVAAIQNLDDPKITDILKKFGYSKFKTKEIKRILEINASHFLKA
ncbi:MAG: amidohydrolase family protein [Promethearchaeota archaeon]